MELTPEQIANYKEAFALFDRNGDQKITTKEIGAVMRSLGLTPTEAELAEMVAEMDSDKNGSVDFDEFIATMSKKLQRQDKEDDVREAFKIFDKSGSGLISVAEFRHVLTNAGDKLTEDELEDLFREADLSPVDGKIKYDELIKVLTAKVAKN